jgi:hypothetical protein
MISWFQNLLSNCSQLVYRYVAAEMVHPGDGDAVVQAREARRRLAGDDLKCFDKKWAEQRDVHETPEDVEAEVVAEAETDPEAGAEAGAEVKTVVDVEVKAEADAEAEAETEAEVEVVAGAGAASEIEPESEAEVKAESGEIEADTEAESEVEEVNSVEVEVDAENWRAAGARRKRGGGQLRDANEIARVQAREAHAWSRASSLALSFAAGGASFLACRWLVALRRRRRQGLLVLGGGL